MTNDDIAFIICGPKQLIDELSGRYDNCADCGTRIFITDGTEDEVEGVIKRPICDRCGIQRFGDEHVDLTPANRDALKATGGDELVRLIEAASINEIFSRSVGCD